MGIRGRLIGRLHGAPNSQLTHWCDFSTNFTCGNDSLLKMVTDSTGLSLQVHVEGSQ